MRGVFLSVDIDVCDPGHAPGTGTPEPGGLSARELLDAVRRICLEMPVVGVDIVEVGAALRPRRHHRGAGQPGGAGGAVGIARRKQDAEKGSVWDPSLPLLAQRPASE